MKLPTWLKIVWWLLLIVGLLLALWSRKSDLLAGSGTFIELTGLIILAALLLAPLFNEISLFGVSLKQQIDDLKKDVTSQMNSLRSDIKNVVDIQTNFSPQFNIHTAPTDAQLPSTEKMVNDAVSKFLDREKIDASKAARSNETLVLDKDVQFLFSTRYHIEKELRQLAERHQLAERRPLTQILRQMSEADVLSNQLTEAIIEVLRVSNPAIHGEKVTAAQIDFAKEVAPRLISLLRALNEPPKS